MPAIDASAPSQVRMRPFDPKTYRADRAAGLARMSANARPDPEAQRRPFLIEIPAPEPPAPPAEPEPSDPEVQARRDDGTVAYWMPHMVPTKWQTLATRRILQVVADHYGISTMDLRGARRNEPIVSARFVAYWFLHTIKGLTLLETGRVLGRADHSSAFNGIDRIKQRIALGHAETLAAVAAVRRKLGIGGEA